MIVSMELTAVHYLDLCIYFDKSLLVSTLQNNVHNLMDKF